MEIFHTGLNHFHCLSTLLFGLGLYGIITRKNPLSWLIGIQLILSGINIALVAFSRYQNSGNEGQVLPVFIIIAGSFQIISAASIIARYYRNLKSGANDNK